MEEKSAGIFVFFYLPPVFARRGSGMKVHRQSRGKNGSRAIWTNIVDGGDD
jgi:hypothetical protein